eukprot:3545880-Rhodomonas_salina.1
MERPYPPSTITRSTTPTCNPHPTHASAPALVCTLHEHTPWRRDEREEERRGDVMRARARAREREREREAVKGSTCGEKKRGRRETGPRKERRGSEREGTREGGGERGKRTWSLRAEMTSELKPLVAA